MTLLDVVDLLTQPSRTPVRQQVAPGRWVTFHVPADALLVQLENAMVSTGSSRDGVTGDKMRVPIDSTSHEEFTRIAREIDGWCHDAGINKKMTPTNALRAWYAWTLSQHQDWDEQETTMRGWVLTIKAMLNPRRTAEILDDCPTCDASTWTDAKSGEVFLHPLVRSYHPDDIEDVAHVPPSTVIRCRACGAEWRGSAEVRYLAWELEHKKDEAS